MRTKVTFDFDASEGLSDFLIPVYFDPNVLVKYLYDPRVSVQFASETYGTVRLEDTDLAFGINSKGTVIAWQGDLANLSISEQHHWRGNNIASQHDIKSEFYDAQINAEFTDEPIAVQTINAVHEWNAGFATKHGVGLYKPISLDQRLAEVRRHKRIMIQSEDDFVRFISELNEFINEKVDNAAVKSFLAAKGVSVPSGSKGNKLLEKVYNDVLGDTTNLIEPFFQLYDLRLWADHDLGDKYLEDVAPKLGITDLNDFEGILTQLLIRLRDAAQKLSATYA
jgi:hypothetical protein